MLRAMSSRPERGIPLRDVHSRSLYRRQPARSLTAFGMTITPSLLSPLPPPIPRHGLFYPGLDWGGNQAQLPLDALRINHERGGELVHHLAAGSNLRTEEAGQAHHEWRN